MFKKKLNAKIHRATVTHADVHYEGSISIPKDLLEISNIGEYEAVNIWNVTQGTRFETYTITGEAESGVISVNGAAAHLVTPGDLIIIASFYYLTPEEAADFKPTLVFVDENNRVKEIRDEVPGPQEPPQVYRV